jgi:hypothetical protein
VLVSTRNHFSDTSLILLPSNVSPLAYAKWIAQEEDYFGGRVGKRINKKLVQG